MGFFRRKLTNTAEVTLPPENTTVYHNYPSRAAVVFVSIIGALIVARFVPVLIWQALVYMVGQLGFRRPETVVAWGIVGLILLLILAGLFVACAKWLLKDYYQFRQEMMDKQLGLMMQQARIAQLVPPQTAASMSYEEYRKYQAVKLTMDRAYHQGIIDDAGKLLSQSQPWSARGVGSIKLPGERNPIGKDSSLASWVLGYLLDRQILLSERAVNIKGFPDLASVEAQLVRDFGRPISYSGQGDNFSMSGQYINKGSGGGSFA